MVIELFSRVEINPKQKEEQLMDLNRQEWYVRWFFWSLGVWDTFLDRDRAWQMEQRGTNLCFFFRTMLIWAPLVLALHAVVYGAAVAALTIVPIYFLGGSSYFWSVGAIATLILVILGVKALRDYYFWRREATRDGESRVHYPIVAPAESIPAGPSFFQVLWKWLVAQKKKICPLITFPKQKEVRS